MSRSAMAMVVEKFNNKNNKVLGVMNGKNLVSEEESKMDNEDIDWLV